MKNVSVLRNVVAGLAIYASASVAQAGQLLEVQSDESKFITIPSAPGAVIIGNPSIADISIDGTRVFVHGRGFGQTTLLILDPQGNQLANFDVAVTHTQVTNVVLFRGTARSSYSCAPYCENELQIGDEIDHFKNISDEMKTKLEISTGSKSAEAKAPTAPQ